MSRQPPATQPDPERILAPVACLNTIHAPAFLSLLIQVFGRRVRCVDVATGDLILCRRYRGRLFFQKIISESDPEEGAV